jgi:hypothetical protein
MLPNRFHPFRPRLLDTLQGYNRQRFFTDLGAGITVGIVALPLALAFGIASGVKPEQGLITAVIAGFLISALGGSQVQIGGPAGAFIVIVYGIIDRYGFTNLLVSTVMAGMLMFVLGLFKLGVLIRYIPVSVVIGFTNGIAVLIALSQLRDLMGLAIAKMPGDFFSQLAALAGAIASFNPMRSASAWFAWPGWPYGRGCSRRAGRSRPGSCSANPCARGAPAGAHRGAGRVDAGGLPFQIAGGNHRLALRRTAPRPAQPGPAALELGQPASAHHPHHHDRAAGRHRIAAVRPRGRQHDQLQAPRLQPGTDGAGRGQHRHAVLRRHPGHRHHRAHRDQCARRCGQPGGWHRACDHTVPDPADRRAAGFTRAAGGAGRHPAVRGLEHVRRPPVHAAAPVLSAVPHADAGHLRADHRVRPHGGGGGGPGAGLRVLHLAHEHAVQREAAHRKRSATGRGGVRALRRAVLRRGGQDRSPARTAARRTRARWCWTCSV